MRAQPLLQDGAVVSFSSDVTTYSEMQRANPFFGMKIGRLFSSHPDPNERIRRLRAM